MQIRRLGRHGFSSSSIALGCMSMSDPSGLSEPAERESIATINHAIDSGITLLDTGDFYGMGHNEMLIGHALKGRRDKVQLSVKFGALRDHRGMFLGFDGRPAYVKASLAYSLQRLKTDYIDFYFPARVDRAVPIEDTIGAVADLVREGKVRYIGLSEASAQTIRRASTVHPISALEIEYSLWSREIEETILPTTRELNIGILAYSVLSRGLLTGSITEKPTDFRAGFPRFQPENMKANLALVDKLKQIADRRNATVPQLAIAWALAQGNDIIPVVGTKTRARLNENLAAAQLELTPSELKEIEATIPKNAAAGARYPEHGMASLDG
jgi:aryl-alcohol dehydrogenase-like predicted oxidoreductase